MMMVVVVVVVTVVGWVVPLVSDNNGGVGEGKRYLPVENPPVRAWL